MIVIDFDQEETQREERERDTHTHNFIIMRCREVGMHRYSSRKKCSARSCFVQESLKHGSPLVRTAAVKAAAELATGSEFVSTHGVAVARSRSF